MKNETSTAGMCWIIEHRFASGWDDAGWDPATFAIRRKAVAVIDEFIQDTKAEHTAGNLSDAYRRRDYRVVKRELYTN
jgi:hypothetical protein